jgi:hypothetical protein
MPFSGADNSREPPRTPDIGTGCHTAYRDNGYRTEILTPEYTISEKYSLKSAISEIGAQRTLSQTFATRGINRYPRRLKNICTSSGFLSDLRSCTRLISHDLPRWCDAPKRA